MHFKDKVIWITGASSGIGAALAKKLAGQHAILILTARNMEALRAIQQECMPHTKHCFLLPADLMTDDLQRLAAEALALAGRIDIHISCAGVSQRSLAAQTSMEVYRELMEINYFVPVGIAKQLMPHFSERGAGHIVVVGSMAGLMGFPMRTGYAAAKHALKGFFETLQIEAEGSGLLITIVSPGRINTPISLSAVTGSGETYKIMDAGQVNGIPVDKCADKILTGIVKKKKHVIIARGERLLWWFWWFWPNLYFRIAGKAGRQ